MVSGEIIYEEISRFTGRFTDSLPGRKFLSFEFRAVTEF
jgi:hypothetical protein